MKSFLKTYRTYFISFIIPLVIMLGVYLSQGIYWNSDTSPLLGDGFHQYVIFDVALRNILHGNGSLFYTFTSCLGLNFYALSSYYLGSFLSPLVYFFNLSNMPDAVYLTTLLKFGLIGLSTFFSLNRLFKEFHCQSIRDKNLARCFYPDSFNYNWFTHAYNRKEAPAILYKSVNLVYSKLLFWIYDSIVSYFLVSLPNFMGL